ncbi:helix-turn-helix transcriptional regulator [Pseudoflavitalea sp. X16]|uniref:helix-turn-helix domain-containing protein n=1 Tax=Paraflavitalea devenefica TaxID=2716334 RepID=UPI001421CD39|nr:helix-turn-helix transcriptional regulator [Paraflavitalea devenefica]
MENLGIRIQKRRVLLGLLQPELAAISGISTRTIQLIERGQGNPSLETLIKLIDPLGLKIELVLKDPTPRIEA